MTTEGRKRVQTTKGTKARVQNAPRATNRVSVAATAQWVITHYTLAWEDDPIYAKDALVSAKGLNEKHRENFLFGNTGVPLQGSGLTSDGKYITLDWTGKGPGSGRNRRFKYGIGGRSGPPIAWRTIAVDPSVIPSGSEVEIEIYKDKGPFLARDTGSKIKGRHIDVFVGAISMADAKKLGKKRSKVKIL